MAKTNQQVQMSTGGIMRYFSDYKSKLVIKPGYVIMLSIGVIATVLLLHALKP